MEQKFSKKIIHLMFSTDKGEALILEDKESIIYDYLSMQLKEQHCTPKAINGMPDHIHLLFELNQPKPIHEIVSKVKENSRYWINKQGLLCENFTWQKGSGVFNIHERDAKSLSTYILNQKGIHQTISFKEEYMSYLKLNLL
ncbi:MAG: transposase [Bacteroidia bacterium]|nr:transposase [Bacteroidia bacterium]